MSLEAPIAVVGNATPSAAWGRVIDRYPSVIRLNNYRLDGFEHLVGSRTDVRCTSAWYDIEHRPGLIEISPFAADVRESENLAPFNAVNGTPVLAARQDVRPLIAETPNPSTGLTLAQLLDVLGIDADFFAFDGFRTPHYWAQDQHVTSHASTELAALLSRPHVALISAPADYARSFAVRGSRFHLRRGYQERATPAYFPDVDEGVVWQPDVYRLLSDLAEELDCRQVVDLGCGRARKLAALHPAFDIVGVDMGSNLEHCREQFSFGRWLEADFERPVLLSKASGASSASAIVCSDVIEHLADPAGLLATMRDLLEHAPFAIVTTPERELTHGVEHNGPPPNPAHVREWSASELASYVASAGLDVAYVGLTASHSVTYEPQTTLLLLTGTQVTAADRERLVTACRARLTAYANERAS